MAAIDLLHDELFNKILLSALTCVATVAAKYLKDLSHSMESMSKDVGSLNKEMGIIVTKIESHEKRIDNIEEVFLSIIPEGKKR